MTSQGIWVATLCTPHWSFTATGKTMREARSVLMKGWRVHAKQTGCDPKYIVPGDVRVLECPLGMCLRDDRIIFPCR